MCDHDSLGRFTFNVCMLKIIVTKSVQNAGGLGYDCVLSNSALNAKSHTDNLNNGHSTHSHFLLLCQVCASYL